MAFDKEKDFIQDKIVELEKHLKTNKRDYPAQRSLTKQRWVIKKLSLRN